MTLTTAAPALAESLQALIDARLDTVERMLLGQVPRPDRLAIVNEVEAQIHELLGDRDPQLLTSDDVLEVLRRLDPPEAYLSSENLDARTAEHHVRRAATIVSTAPKTSAGREGSIGGVAGLCAFGLVVLMPLFYLLAMASDSTVIFFGGLACLSLVGIAGSIAGLVLSIRGRQQGVLPVLGLIGSSLALPIWLLGSLYFVLTEL
jgi:hypothetical protein